MNTQNPQENPEQLRLKKLNLNKNVSQKLSIEELSKLEQRQLRGGDEGFFTPPSYGCPPETPDSV